MCDVLDVPYASQVCPWNSFEVQCAELFCQSGIFLVSSQDVGIQLCFQELYSWWQKCVIAKGQYMEDGSV
jgi:hypothetical protein